MDLVKKCCFLFRKCRFFPPLFIVFLYVFSLVEAHGAPNFRDNVVIAKYKNEVGLLRASMATEAAGGRMNRYFKRLKIAEISRKNDLKIGSVEGFIEALMATGQFEYVEPNYIWSLNATPNDPSFNALWGLHNNGQNSGTPDADIDAPEAWDINTGSSDTVIAIIDTGVQYNHIDLAANMWVNPGEIPGNGLDDDGNGYIDDIYGIDAVNNDSDPMDDQGHGTHCAGTIGAVGNNGVGVVGVNWDVSMIALKFLDASGNGYTSDAVECLNYLLDLKENRGINVRLSSNSWGGGSFSQALYDVIEECKNADILTVCAAGNDYGVNNDTTPHFPSSYESDGVIAVASTDRNDGLSTFSNIGFESVDIAAPGTSIYSAIIGNTYGTKSGTSMATPHVSGVLGLIFSEYPAYGYLQAKSALLYNGDTLASLAGVCSTESRVNALLSLQNGGNLQSVQDPTISPDSSSFTTAIRVTLTSTTTGASIYYTSDGSDPNTQSTLYTGPFDFLGSGATEFKARAFKTGYIPSSVASKNYQFPLGTLSLALGEDLDFSTGGNTPWSVVNGAGGDGAYGGSGNITHNQLSWIETTVTGPGRVEWKWSVSSEYRYDFLRFYVDSSVNTVISGNVDWTTVNVDIPAGSHTLRWSYEKDFSIHSGSDKGWVDGVVFYETYGDYLIEETDAEVEIVEYMGRDSTVQIPETMNGKPVVTIRTRAFQGNTILQNVTIPKYVSSIGNLAFSGCSNLVSATMECHPPSVGSDVFLNTSASFVINVHYGMSYPETWNGYPTTTVSRSFNDYSGDFKDDLMLQDKYGFEVVSQRLDGNGSLVGSPTEAIAGAEYIQFLSIVNMDQDGLGDLLVRNLDGSNTFEVWYRNWDGQITGSKTFDPGADSWRIVGAYDQNKDGNTDLVWQDIDTGRVVIWYLDANNNRSSFSQLVGSMTEFRIITVEDINLDGTMDFLWQRYSPNGQSTIVYWPLDSNAKLLPAGSQTLAIVNGNWFCAGLGIINDDARPDLIWQNVTSGAIISWILDAGLQRTTSYSLWPGSPEQLYANWRWELGADMEPWDFNNDGNADLLWQRDADDHVSEWYMDDSFGINSNLATVEGTAPGKLVGMADINEDGINDYIWTFQLRNRQIVTVWKMNLDRTIQSSVELGRVAAPYVYRGVGDMNSDGHEDILWQNSLTGKVIVWYLDGNETKLGYAALTGSIPVYHLQLVEDFNADGNDDLIWQGESGGKTRILVWFMNGNGVRNSYVSWATVVDVWSLINVTDYTNDGHADAIWHDKNGGRVIGWELDDSNVRTDHQTIATGIGDWDFAHW